MKIAVFGATGRTGRPLIKEALTEGHEVVALARDPSKLDALRHERLRVVRGDVLDPAAVDEAVAGSDAVISVLGHAKGSPKDVQTRGTENIVAAMQKHGVRRLVSLTGAGVRDPGDRPKLVDRVFGLLLRVLDRDTLKDAEGHAEVIKRSGLDWVIVRGPRLTEGPKKGTYRVGLVGKNSGTQVSRADLAGFMLRQAANDEYLRQMPVVSY
jgi:putative NADH-flavin reductase